MTVENTLAYHDAAKIMTVISFIVLAPQEKTIKDPHSSILIKGFFLIRN
jgi:hypothetical protein